MGQATGKKGDIMRSRQRLSVLASALVILLIGGALAASATFTPGYWKNRGVGEWSPGGTLVTTGVGTCGPTGFGTTTPYPFAPADTTYLSILENPGAKDMSNQLAVHTIAAQLNVHAGACQAEWGDEMIGLVGLANTFLAGHPVGSSPQGVDRSYAESLKTCLDLHNNIPDGTTAAGYNASPAKACADTILS